MMITHCSLSERLSDDIQQTQTDFLALIKDTQNKLVAIKTELQNSTSSTQKIINEATQSEKIKLEHEVCEMRIEQANTLIDSVEETIQYLKGQNNKPIWKTTS